MVLSVCHYSLELEPGFLIRQLQNTEIYGVLFWKFCESFTKFVLNCVITVLNHENTEIHIKPKITEMQKFIKKELLTGGNMKKLPTKQVRKSHKHGYLWKLIKTKSITTPFSKLE